GFPSTRIGLLLAGTRRRTLHWAFRQPWLEGVAKEVKCQHWIGPRLRAAMCRCVTIPPQYGAGIAPLLGEQTHDPWQLLVRPCPRAASAPSWLYSPVPCSPAARRLLIPTSG